MKPEGRKIMMFFKSLKPGAKFVKNDEDSLFKGMVLIKLAYPIGKRKEERMTAIRMADGVPVYIPDGEQVIEIRL